MVFRPRLSSLTAPRLYNTGRPSLLLRPAHGCIDACTDALRAGLSRIGVFVPPGSSAFSDPSSSASPGGAPHVKTAALLTLISRIAPPAGTPAATRALVIVRSAARAQQAAVQAARLFPHWTVEIDDETAHHASGTADVTIATHRTLFDTARLAKYDSKHLKAIVVDEAHHAASALYRRFLWRFVPEVECIAPRGLAALVRKAPSPGKIPIVGFSAAYTQQDGHALRGVFQQIVCIAGVAQLVRDRWMGNARVTTVQAAPALAAHTLDTPDMSQNVVQTWLARAAGRATLVLCHSTDVDALTGAFRAAGVHARGVHSRMSKGDRSERVKQFMIKEFLVLVHYVSRTRIGAEALPAADCVFVALQTRSPTHFAHTIGHGLSPYKDCHIFDCVASMPRTAGIVSTPVLFGLDPTQAIDDETLESLEARSPPPAETFPDDVPVPVLDTNADADTRLAHANNYNTLFSGDSSGAPDVRTLSPHAWVGCDVDGRKVYVLDFGRVFGYLYIESVAAAGPDPACFVVTHTRGLVFKGSAHALPVADPDPDAEADTSPDTDTETETDTPATGERVLTADTLEDAVRGADAYAARRAAKRALGEKLLLTAYWRAAPASARQRLVLRNAWAQRQKQAPPRPRAYDAGEANATAELTIRELTQGQASDLIARVKHEDRALGVVVPVSGGGGGGAGGWDDEGERCDEDKRYEEREIFSAEDGHEMRH